MSRRAKPLKREAHPDAKYGNVYLQQFIHRVMRRGKKSIAQGMMYDSLAIVEERTGKSPVEVLEQALRNVGPVMEVRPRRVGGATYQVPMEVPASRRNTLAMRWIIDAAKARTGKSFAEKMSAEFWMPPITWALRCVNVRKLTKWLRPTAPSRITACKFAT